MSKLSRQSVLIVDDTPENIDVLRGILAPHYALRVANSGSTALRAATAEPTPDLILLDVVMPDFSGLDVCRALKADARTRNIPIIFVTARSEDEDEALGFSLGAADYLTKPVSAPVVLARVRTHLALYERSQHLEDLVAERTAALTTKSRQLEATQLVIIQRLARAAEFRDNETGMHVIRFSRYARLLAMKIGMSDEDAEQIMHASMMHDVGKIGVPDHVLLKPARLTPEEFEVIKRHPEIGAEIIGDHDSPLLQMAASISMTHHERWDGKGYPRQLKGEEIPIAGRICAIADIFDALTSVRPYKEAWSVDAAMDYLQEQSGHALEPRLVEAFIALRGEIENIMQEFRDHDSH